MSRARISLHCLARTWMVGAAMTTRGMQHLGLLYALEPGLKCLYPDPTALAAARLRYLDHVNTHPFMAPLFVGMLLALEKQVAAGTLAPQMLHMIKSTTATTLSALGDSFFSGTVLVFWSLTTILLLLSGQTLPAAAWTLFLFILQLGFRVWSFYLGLRQGMLALQRIRQLDCLNWGDRLKTVNALLLAVLLWKIAPFQREEGLSQEFFWSLLCLGSAGFLIARVHVPRLLLAGLLFSVLLVGDALRLLE